MQTKLFVNNLTVIDCSYLNSESGLTGMSWQVDVELSGDLDNQGMIFDFALVKKSLKNAIDQQLDHRLLVPANLANIVITETNQQTEIHWQNESFGTIVHSSPSQAVAVLPTDMITADFLNQYIAKTIRSILPDNVTAIDIQLIPETIIGPCFQYSHGLKKHRGACQRIAHGHRSRLAIYRNDELDNDLIKTWCDDFQHIYIATREDLIDEHVIEGILHYQFGYQSQEGEFSLTLPQRCCYLIDTESTIENIAQHLLTKLLIDFPDDQWIVKAFEGMHKGAISTNTE